MLLKRLLPASTLVLAFGLVQVAWGVATWDDDGNSANKNWSHAANWSLNFVPGNTDNVEIGNHANAVNDWVQLDQSDTILSLTLSRGVELYTNTHELIIQGGPTQLDGTTGSVYLVAEDRDPLQPAATTNLDSVDADSIDITNGAYLEMRDGVVEVDSGALRTDSGSTIIGHGRIDLRRADATPELNLDNEGQIIVTGGDMLIQNDSVLGSNGTVDLDGLSLGNGVVSLVDGDLTISAHLSDTVFNGSVYITDNNNLAINDDWALANGATMRIGNGGSLSGGNVTIYNDAEILAIGTGTGTFNGVDVNISSGTPRFDVETAATLHLSSGGTVTFSAAGASFTGAGILQPGSTNVVDEATQIGTPGTNTLRLDMDVGNWTLNDDLSLDVAETETISDGCDCTITINNNAHFNIDQTGNFKMQGNFNLNGATIDNPGATTAIELDGHASIHANSGVNTFSLFVDFLDGTSTVTVTSGATLYLPGAHYRGGSFTGEGWFRPGSSTVQAATTFAVDEIQLDSGPLHLNASLTVDTDSIGSGSDGFDNLFDINNTTLDVNVSSGEFAMQGTFELDGASISSTMDGNTMTFSETTAINANTGTSTFNLPVNFLDATNTTTIAPGATLRFNDGAIFRGGTYQGTGILRAGDSTVEAPTTIGVANNLTLDLDWGGWTLNDDLTLMVDKLEDSTDGFDDTILINSGAKLSVNTTAGAWDMEGLIQLKGGDLAGPDTINNLDDTSAQGILGYGTVTAQVVNDHVITAEGGTLIVNNSANDWDGTTNTGRLVAQSGGVLQMEDMAQVIFHGSAFAAFGGDLFANGFSLHFGPGATLSLNQGTFRATHFTSFDGTMTVAAGGPSTIKAELFEFDGPSQTTLNDDLHLAGPIARVVPGASFSGGGTLINDNGSLLRWLDGANIQVAVENRGSLALGTSPGQVLGLDFQQTSAGELLIELGGTDLSDFDRMNLTGVAQLAGDLIVSFYGGFDPVIGHAFPILSATGGRFGEFDEVTLPVMDPDELMLVDYGDHGVTLLVVELLAADFDEDGDVDDADLALWETGYGISSGADHDDGDANDDGAVTGSDFFVWQQQYGDSVLPLSASNVAVPEPTTMLLMLGAVGALAMSRRNG